MPSARFFFVAAAGLLVFFAGWTALMLKWGEIPAFDLDCAYYCRQHAESGMWDIVVFLTDAGGVAAMTLLTIIGALWQASLSNRQLALAWILIASGGGILNSGVKHAVDRDRPGMHHGQIVDPNLRDRAVLELNQSYPSGHSMGSAVGYGLLAYTLCLWQTCRWRRLLIVAICALIVVAIGLSRMYLRAHWLSDVVGGWTLGLAWLFFCLGWLERWRLHKPVA